MDNNYFFNSMLQFAHGCLRGCPRLTKYVGNQEETVLKSRTLDRDRIINRWIDLHVNSKSPIQRASYQVFTDCHHEDYRPDQLEKHFRTVDVLKDLTDGYTSWNRIHMDEVINCDPKLTFVAVVQGYCQSGSKPLLLPTKIGNWQRCGNTGEKGKVILSQDYLNYLRMEHDFKVTKVLKAFFYRKCNLLAEIYDSLVKERHNKGTSPVLVQVIKSIVNFSCGYFGFNPNKRQAVSTRIVEFASKNYDISTYALEIGGIAGNKEYYIQRKFTPPGSKLRCPITPLPLYVMIVEYGKMRMAQHLSFLDRFVGKTRYRHLYSNTDNAVIAIAEDSLDEAVAPELREDYYREKPDYVSADAGNLKIEWCLESDGEWKFASAMVHNYAVVASDAAVHKNSSLSNISAERSYDIACKMLERNSVEVEQERRVNKLLNTDTKQITLVMGVCKSSIM